MDLISLAGPFLGMASILRTGRSLSEMKKQLSRIEVLEKEKLGLLREIGISNTRMQQKKLVLSDLDILDVLRPIQSTTGGAVVSSLIVPTPEKMRSRILSSPHDYLDNIGQLDNHCNRRVEQLVGIIYKSNNQYFVGTQHKSKLPALFDCDCNDIFHKKLYGLDKFEFPFGLNRYNTFEDVRQLLGGQCTTNMLDKIANPYLTYSDFMSIHFNRITRKIESIYVGERYIHRNERVDSEFMRREIKKISNVFDKNFNLGASPGFFRATLGSKFSEEGTYQESKLFFRNESNTLSLLINFKFERCTSISLFFN